MLDTWFLKHPRAVGETYGRHLFVCWGFSARLFGASLACLIHGLMPGLFERTGSRAIAALHDEMISKRSHASHDWRMKRVD